MVLFEYRYEITEISHVILRLAKENLSQQANDVKMTSY